MASELHTNLQAQRARLGWSQSELADRAGLSRHTILAIEQGRMTPSTAIALRLAELLQCRVEALFWLDAGDRALLAAWQQPRPARMGERLKLGWVAGQWQAHPLELSDPLATRTLADAVVTGQPGPQQVAVDLLDRPERLREQLLVAGCDPSLGLLAAHAAQRFADLRVHWLDVPSERALELLGLGAVHLAGAHLYDPRSSSFNRATVQRALPGRHLQLVRLAQWQLGWVLRPGNPKGFGTAADLGRGDVALVNRPIGAGARHLLDRLLGDAGLKTAAVSGYERAVHGHFDVAQCVALGLADVGVATQLAAQAFGLEFVPLQVEDFDLVLPAAASAEPRVLRLLEVLASPAFRRELEVLGGYDLGTSGVVCELG